MKFIILKLIIKDLKVISLDIFKELNLKIKIMNSLMIIMII
jgi:hypothetical protein